MPDLFEQLLPACSFGGVGPLPVVEQETDGGHAFVEHEAYGRAGADLEPTGQKAYRGSVTFALFNGLRGFPSDLWPDRYYDLLVKIEAGVDTFVHHTKGSFQALLHDWKEKADPDHRDGVYLTVQWVEHNASAGKLLGTGEGTPQTSTERARDQAQTADDAAAQAGAKATGYTDVAPVVGAQLSALEALDQPTPQQIAAAFGAMLSPVAANLSLAALSLAAAHDAVVALEDLRATLVALQQRFLGNAASSSSFTVPADMALWEVAVAVYGAASRASLISGANRVPDPSRIRAGTVLLCPPVPAGA
jgi:hypothetical protein